MTQPHVSANVRDGVSVAKDDASTTSPRICNNSKGFNKGGAAAAVTSSKPYSTASTPGPVELSYTSAIPSSGNDTEGALVVIHGLFGSKRNFASLLKAFQRDLDRPVYGLDLRNHGASPHAKPMTYEAMAEDVHTFIEKMKLTDVSIMGHSMGGKVAMTLALGPSPPKVLSNLIVSDIAPTQASLGPAFVGYMDAMLEIADPRRNIRTRDEANKYLAEREKDMSVRQFLLTNLVTPSSSEPDRHTVKWQIPVSLIKDAAHELGSFPYTPEGGQKWEGRTLVVKGASSKHINKKNIPLLEKFFPNMRLEILDTGHWVHAEKPHEFTKLMVDFILQK